MENAMSLLSLSSVNAPFIKGETGHVSPEFALAYFGQIPPRHRTDVESEGADRGRIAEIGPSCIPLADTPSAHVNQSRLSEKRGPAVANLAKTFQSDDSLARWLEELAFSAPLRPRDDDAGPVGFIVSDVHAGRSGNPLQLAAYNGVPNRLRVSEGTEPARPVARALTDSGQIAGEVLGALTREGEAVVFLIRLRKTPGDCASFAATSTGAGLPKWRLKRACAFVEANLEGTITLSALAGAAGLSQTYFAALFKISTGLRPHEYVMRRRIETAKQQLLDPKLSIIEIAIGVGFQTQAHFTTSFKNIVGQTPCRWRRENYVDR
jgi:AraC-like DNA-binding protein